MEKKLAMMEVERFAIHDGPGISKIPKPSLWNS